MDNCFDSLYYSKGALIAGLDETGVVDIAGPLVAACVILPKIDVRRDDLRIFEINDSKQVPRRYHARYAEIIWRLARGIGIGEVSPMEIDYLGRHVVARRLAMMRAIAACARPGGKKLVVPDFLLIDGNAKVELPTTIPQELVPKGDTKSLCIAAASILAKVCRDKIMVDLHKQYPHYGWNTNKGHPGCERHLKGLDTYGVQIGVHRLHAWPFVKTHDEEPSWEQRRKRWRTLTQEQLYGGLQKGDSGSPDPT